MIYLLLPVYLVVILITILSPQNIRTKAFLYFFVGFLLVLLAGFRVGDPDYENYVENFNLIKNGVKVLIEPSFTLISILSPTSTFLFVFYAVLGISLKLIAIRRLTDLWFLSLVMYCSYFFILHEMTQIRAGVAAGLLLLCIKPIYDRDWKSFLLYSIFAVFFHTSAIVIFPLWFLGHKHRQWFLLSAVPIGYLVYFADVNIIELISIPGVSSKIDSYNRLQEIGNDMALHINVFNIVFVFKIFIYYLLVLKYDFLLKANKYTPILMKIFALSFMCLPMFSKMPVVAFRISELYGVVEIILFSMLFYLFKPKFLALFLTLVLSVVLISVNVFYNKLVY